MTGDKAPREQLSELRKHLRELLTGAHAHADFETILSAVPPSARGMAAAPAIPHTMWQLLEHLRIAQRDILDFSRDPGYSEPKWPDDYWPSDAAPPDDAAWNGALETFRADLRAMVALVEDPATDLFAPIPWGKGQTVLREALLVADHNAYHLGQIVDLRRALECWPPEGG